MNKNNLGDILTVLDLHPVASVTADGNSTGVDVSQLEGQLAIVLDAKNTAGTTPTLAIKLQDCDTVDGTYTDVAGGAFAALDADPAAAVEKLVISVDGLKKFLRVNLDIGGTSTPTFLVSVKGYGMNKYPA